MRLDGRLRKWDPDRGFGFIAPSTGGHDVFAHISAFPKSIRNPSVGDLLSYEVERAADGKMRAVRIRRFGVPEDASDGARFGMRRFVSKGMSLALVILVAAFVFSYSRDFFSSPSPAFDESPLVSERESDGSTHYVCDGRIHCSQMTSCEEAYFFLNNCPGVKMDGNQDGEPCEQQWCR